jgi:O-succinylbenzoic acid--CoA ligase
MDQSAEPAGLPDFGASPWHGGELPAVSAGALVWSYQRLAMLAGRRAEMLRGAGVRPGQVVACGADAGAELVLLQHALARIGAALLPLRPDLAEPELNALITATGTEWRWHPDARGGGAAVATGRTPPPSLWANDALALLVETSGSSGKPKAAMLTRCNLLTSCSLVNRRLGLGAGDEWLCCLPLQHVGGLAIGYRCALAGATLRLHKGFDTNAVRADLSRRRITHLSLVPPMLARLLDAGADMGIDGDLRPPPSLRVLLMGGQALSGALARRAIAAGWPLFVSYGMSETFSLVATAFYRADGDGAPETGAPLPGVELDWGPRGAPPRPLRLRGPMLMAGYANPERRPGVGLDGSWFATSDLACIDDDGGLRVLGRADDALVIGGVTVLPAVVEERLAALPGIEAVAVVGVPHPVWGRTLAACYAGARDHADLEHWCRAHLPGAERPRIFVRCPRLPLLASGKVDRGALTAMAAAAPGGDEIADGCE